MKNALFVILCLSLFFIPTGCGNGNSAADDEDTIEIVIVNETEDIYIPYAVFYGLALDEWGKDLLEDDLIEPGDVFTFILPQDSYEIDLFTVELYVVKALSGVDSDTRIVVGGEGKHPILFKNESDADIAEIYIFPTPEEDLQSVEGVGDVDLGDDSEPANGDLDPGEEDTEEPAAEEEEDLENSFGEDDLVDWGENLMGGIRFVPARIGAYFFFVEPGIYNFVAVDLSGEVVAAVIALEVEGARTLTFGR